MVIVAPDIREIRSIDIPIIGERLTVQVEYMLNSVIAVYYAAYATSRMMPGMAVPNKYLTEKTGRFGLPAGRRGLRPCLCASASG